MKKVVLLVLMLSAFCLPSMGQRLIVYEDGEKEHCFGGIADALFDFRIIYGRYPNDKKEFLDFHLDAVKYDSEVIDYSIFIPRAAEMKMVTKQIKNRRNKLTVSGDTCSFYIAKERCTVQCIGGTAEMQIYYNDNFRAWIRSRFYDKEGKHIWPLDEESPMMRKEVNGQFRYVVTLNPYEDDDPEAEVNVKEESIDGSWRYSPLFVPITITRSGEIGYGKDISRLKGARLYYQEYGKQFSLKSAIGTITLEEALNPDRLDAIKAYMKDYFDEHQEVERAELWEMLMFNNPPVAKEEQ